MKKHKCPASCPADTSSNGTSNHTEQSLESTSHHNQQYLGYIGAIIAVLFFGSNFVPVKKYETGDGEGYRFVLSRLIAHFVHLLC